MAKFFGKVGFSVTVELDPINEPGVYGDSNIEREYCGDVLQNRASWEQSTEVNDNFNINVRFSLLLDPFAEQYCQKIKYIEYMGGKWKVKSIEIQYPRIILTVGGVYNGEQAGTA